MTLETFGTYDGAPVLAATLRSEAGVAVRVLSYGCVVQSWTVPDATGAPREVTLGFPTFDPYPANAGRAFGIVAGRIANRVREGCFTLDGTTYQLDRNWKGQHLHGGSEGLGCRTWALEADDAAARLAFTSPDGAMGYPGTVAFTVAMRLEGHTLTFDMTGVPDRPTPVQLAQHSYFALGGPVADHVLTVPASRVTEVNDLLIPTGRLVEVAGTPLDFRTPRAIGDARLDINYVLERRAPAVTLDGADFHLEIETDRPGMQVYNSWDMPDVAEPGHDGAAYGPFAGIALEAQDFPDAVNNPAFPSVVVTPDRPYRQTTSVTVRPR